MLPIFPPAACAPCWKWTSNTLEHKLKHTHIFICTYTHILYNTALTARGLGRIKSCSKPAFLPRLRRCLLQSPKRGVERHRRSPPRSGASAATPKHETAFILGRTESTPPAPLNMLGLRDLLTRRKKDPREKQQAGSSRFINLPYASFSAN